MTLVFSCSKNEGDKPQPSTRLLEVLPRTCTSTPHQVEQEDEDIEACVPSRTRLQGCSGYPRYKLCRWARCEPQPARNAMTRTQGFVRGWASADMHAWSCDGSHLTEALRVVQGDEGGNEEEEGEQRCEQPPDFPTHGRCVQVLPQHLPASDRPTCSQACGPSTITTKLPIEHQQA
jgi:hypothetical protein